MSQIGPKMVVISARIGSASPQSTDIGGAYRYFAFVPSADLCTATDDEHGLAYSITSSARVSRSGGISMSCAFAVFRLMTNWNLSGACTGRSAGLAPLRMRCT